MKKRNLIIFLLVLGIVLIVLGISIFIYKEVSDKNKEQKKLEKTIVEKYEIFKTDVESFNKVRSSYYSEVVPDLYPETVESDHESWMTILDDYTNKVNKVEKASDYLKEECVNKNHSNKDVTNKCESFVIAYETVMNYYTKDIESFNEIINQYYEENDVDVEKSEIKKYSLKYNYVDVNSDGEFIGKK